MVNLFIAKVGSLFECKRMKLLFILLVHGFFLCGCASSDVSRDVSSNIDVGVQNAKNLVDGTTGSSLAESYQNASQQAKGAVLGGAAGAVTGGVSSIGIIPGALIGAILGASYGQYIDANSSIEDQLQNRGATIVVLGDQILIVLPSARIFNIRSAKIKQDAYSTLNLVTRYINQFAKMLVKISVYTNGLCPDEVNLSLSQAQADSVARFLTASGIDARVLYAVGYGASHLVQRGSSTWDGSDNYRVEITLEKLYV